MALKITTNTTIVAEYQNENTLYLVTLYPGVLALGPQLARIRSGGTLHL